MKTNNYHSWWREMGAISRGMMFIEGNIATPAALDSRKRSGCDRTPVACPTPPCDLRPDPVFPELKRKAIHLYEELLLLGGRPMTAGHNDDTDEPFARAQSDSAEQPRLHRIGERRRGRAPQPQHCATC
ncbi:MAG TPA: hypothetical protein VIT22_03405 [Pseudoxanthomonas sp.]